MSNLRATHVVSGVGRRLIEREAQENTRLNTICTTKVGTMVEGDKEHKANKDAGRRATLVLGMYPAARPPAPGACFGRGSIDAPGRAPSLLMFLIPLSLTLNLPHHHPHSACSR